MKNKELYDRSVNILVDAYMNDELVAQDCNACAVGNLVCANMDYRMHKSYLGKLIWLDKNGNIINPLWSKVHTVNIGHIIMRTYMVENYIGCAKAQIDSTGYTPEQTSRIEVAFEKGNLIVGSKDEKMFSGLMSVIDVLDEIHENTDEEVTKETKSKFQKTVIC